MKTKLLIYILIIGMLIPVSMAFTGEKEAQKIAKSLNRTSINQTVENIDYWVNNNITYKFFWRARGLDKVWKDRTGDCTDKAMLKVYMLRYLGIEARLVHGFVYNPDTRTRELHDWYEYTATSKRKAWTSIEQRSFYSLLIKGGNGIW